MEQHDFEVVRICVKGYLSDIRHKDMTIRLLEQRITEMRQRLEGLGCCWVDGMPRHPSFSSNDRMADGIAVIVDLQNSWADEIVTDQKEIEHARRLCEPFYPGRYACWLHCVVGMQWKRIADELGYTQRNSQLLANKGMQELYALMPERYRKELIPDALTA